MDRFRVSYIEGDDLLVLTGSRRLSDTVLRELVGVSECVLPGCFEYEFKAFPNNCFVVLALVSRSSFFDLDGGVAEVLRSKVSSLPVPEVFIFSSNSVGVRVPPVAGYERLMKACGAYPAMRFHYKIPFSRLYDAFRVLSSWKHSFLPCLRFEKNFLDLVRMPLTADNTLREVLGFNVKGLISAAHGWKVNLEGFHKLKCDTVGDLLLKRPVSYVNRGDLTDWHEARFNEQVFIKGSVVNIDGGFSKKLYLELREEKSGRLVKVWFFGFSWLARIYKPGDLVVVRVSKTGKDRASGFELLPVEEVASLPICPTYRQSPKNNVSSGVISQCVSEVFYRCDGEGLLDYVEGVDKSFWDLLHDLHYPASVGDYAAAVNQLAYIELLFLQLVFLDRKKASLGAKGVSKRANLAAGSVGKAIAGLPFELTQGQRDAIGVLVDRLGSDEPENILLSADVGAGKSLCAQVACLYCFDAGFQSALVAPTDILAEQLYSSFVRFVECLPEGERPRIGFLSGGISAGEKRVLLEGVASGDVDVLVGTHSVLGVDCFRNLGLVVVDEQQKFGTEQRDRLLSVRGDGRVPDVIAQTATPIPRSTALAFYGDTCLVQIKDKPAGRLPVLTEAVWGIGSDVFLEMDNGPVWELILGELEAGRQMFIVAPAVDEGAKMISVNKIKKMLSRFGDRMRVRELSGRDSKDRQARILADFRDGKFNVLVASSVVEVGIDVPNATVMVVVGADRFGVSSLHQIRGRVGRSSLQSYCFLVPDSDSSSASARIDSLVASNDGFEIALADLSTRNQGDILGSRQSGESSLRFCDLTDHSVLIDKARAEAERLFNSGLRVRAVDDAYCFLGLGG